MILITNNVILQKYIVILVLERRFSQGACRPKSEKDFQLAKAKQLDKNLAALVN